MWLIPAPVRSGVPVGWEGVFTVVLWVGLNRMPAWGWGASGELTVPILLRLDFTYSSVSLIRWFIFFRGAMRVKPSLRVIPPGVFFTIVLFLVHGGSFAV